MGLQRQSGREFGARDRARERAARETLPRLEAALQACDTLAAARSPVDRVSTTDPDARVMKPAEGGSAPSVNVQISTDASHGLIVGIDVTQAYRVNRRHPEPDRRDILFSRPE